MAMLLSVFVGAGLLLIVLAVPLIRRRVPPNAWYGLRVAATFADEWVWYEANARSGRDMLVVGILQVVVAVLLGVLAIPETVYAVINIGVLLAGTVAFAVVGIRRANRLAMQHAGSRR